MSEILKKLRALHNYSQSYVAEYLNVSRQMYIKYESGEVEPSVKIITKLCQLYKVSYSTILGELNFSQEKTDDLYNTQKSEDFYVASPDVCYGAKKTYSPLQSKAINQIKELSDFQVISVLAYMKLLNEEIAENSKNKQRKSMAGIIDSVDPIEVERINAVYDKIPREEQLRFTKVGSK